MNQIGKRLYNQLRGSILHPQWLTDRFQSRIRKQLATLRRSVILDIGSGNSRNTRYVDDSNTVLCLDYPATNPRYQVRPDIFADARNLPIASDSLDTVFLFEVLEHVPTPERVVKEICRTLRPLGKLFMSVPFIYPIHDAPYDFQRFTIYGLRHLLQREGFELTYVAQNGNPLVVPIQLLNLALLAGCQAAWQRHVLLGVIALALSYPICLLNNILALPLTLLPDRGRSCFGYFVIAERK